MTLSSKKWRRPAIVCAVVGVLALAGYFVATNQQVRDALEARAMAGSATSQSADHAQAAAGAEAVHAHGSGEPTVKTTLWAKQVDIFLERPYAVAGKAIEPLFHCPSMFTGRF